MTLGAAILFLVACSLAMAGQPLTEKPVDGQDTTAFQATKRNPLLISSLTIKGNKVTRDHIILREVMFRAGDSVMADDLEGLLEQSRENLLNTTLFNFVYLTRVSDQQGQVAVTIEVIERWYVWPVPIIKLGDRNFNVWWQTRDFSRLSYGFYIDWRNFRGRRENLITRFQFGYDQLFDVQYFAPYLNEKQTVGAGLGAGFHGNHETAYITEDNKQQFYREENGYARQDIFAFVQVQLRKNIFNTHLFELRFDQHRFSDSLVSLNPSYSVNGQTRLNYLTFHYKFKSDHRDFAPYPLRGYYLDAEVYKYGLGVEGENAPDYFNLLATFRKYWQLSGRFYLAAGVHGKYSPEKEQPYFLRKAIGYERDIVRSYEYYVIDGNSFGIMKSNLKFAIIPQRDTEIGFLR